MFFSDFRYTCWTCGLFVRLLLYLFMFCVCVCVCLMFSDVFVVHGVYISLLQCVCMFFLTGSDAIICLIFCFLLPFGKIPTAHPFECLVHQVHVPSFEVQVIPLFRIRVVRGVLRVLRLGSGRGR